MNPGRDELEREGRAEYEALHWGHRTRRVRNVRVSPAPKSLVKLGTLEAVTYSTRKKGDGFNDYEHAFGEEGGQKPVLAVDPKTRRLHIVGGDYTVEDRGIVD